MLNFLSLSPSHAQTFQDVARRESAGLLTARSSPGLTKVPNGSQHRAKKVLTVRVALVAHSWSSVVVIPTAASSVGGYLADGDNEQEHSDS